MEIIREITALETFSVRHPVLRAGKPVESCHFDGDNLDSTKHFGWFENDILAGIVTVLENQSGNFSDVKQFQLRGMAVLENYQKKGIGEKLVLAAENYSKSQNGNLIWFNAREIAIGFYEKCGYKKAGNLFEIPGVGPHYIMYKIL